MLGKTVVAEFNFIHSSIFAIKVILHILGAIKFLLFQLHPRSGCWK